MNYVIMARDTTTSPPGNRVTGLTPAWVFLKRLDNGSNVTSLPSLIEVGQGQYRYTYDPESLGEASGQIDLGNALTSPLDRYVDVVMTLDSSRIVTGINSSGQVQLSSAGLDAVVVESGVNARQALAPILAATGGVLIGAGTGTITVKGGNTTVPRITAQTDIAGNRVAVSLNLPL